MIQLLRKALGCVVLCLLLAIPAASQDESAPWNVPRFSEDAAGFYSAASRAEAPPGADAIVLTDEESYVFDADGKSLLTYYVVYKVLTPRGAQAWGGISWQWAPWHQNRPEIRARVITADGVVHPLDAKTVTDSPASDQERDIYSDRRVLRAPLPAIAPGSVVEEEVVVRELSPIFNAGVVFNDLLTRNVPVQHARLLIDAPSSLPLQYKTQLLSGLKPARSEADGRVRLSFDAGPLLALEEPERYLPNDIPQAAVISFSTGHSWQTVAEQYAAIVDRQMELKDVQSLVARLMAGKTTREAKIAAIVQYLGREIRYTGIEFDDATLVPHPPAETLNHKYGDCKDKAVLAVAMLRAAGIPAYVALLNVGQRQDPDEDLPGMGVFDHAIVYAPGAPDFWIDATALYARAGQLPGVDQGRLALVARAETDKLLRTPRSGAEENRVLEKREFFLADYGPARVVETTEPQGVFESEYRSYYANAESEAFRKNLKDYVSSQYLAEKLDRMEPSDPGDLSKPFQLLLEAGNAKRGFTELESAVVAIRLESLFSRLPNELQEREKEEKTEKSADNATEKPKKRRTADYQLPYAYVNEWRYRLVPPSGFQAKELPESTKILLGPAVLSEEFSLQKDGAAEAVLRFDTVKQRFTSAEATEMKEKIAQLREGQPILIYFEPTAQALMNAGKVREGFKVYRDLIAQHPKEAVHHMRRAKALLAGGMGQAAREEAREAVKLEPDSAPAEKVLANILEYDLVGRQYRHGSDYAGAEAAFRAVEKLDPDDKASVANLAILLEHDAWGLRYGPGAKLHDAVAEYHKLLPADLKELGVQNNLAFALLYAGEFSEGLKVAETLNPQPVALIVACETALHGAQAGLAEARKRTAGEEEFKQAAKTAGYMMSNLRKYALAADLLEAGASGSEASDTAADALLFRKTQPHEAKVFPDDPVGAALRYELLEMNADLTLEQMRSVTSRNGKSALADPEVVEMLVKEARASISSKVRQGQFDEVGKDIALARAQPKTEGNDNSGYKITLFPSATYKTATYVVKEEGSYKVLGTTRFPAGVGLEVLDRVAANDLAGARTLLDWLRADMHLVGGDDPLSSAAFPRLWTKGENSDAAGMKLAAAALLVFSKETAAKGLALAEQMRTSATDETQKVNIELVMGEGYVRLEQYDKTLPIWAGLSKQYAESKRLFYSQWFALRWLGRFEEAERLAEDRLQRLPEDIDAMRALVLTAVAQEDYAKAHTLDAKILEEGKAEPTDLNSLAWHSLFTGKVLDSDFEDALKAAELSQKNSAVMHTLACIYAERGKTKEAREVLVQAMDQLNLDEPDADYWYGLGRIAEAYGERDIAIADYNKVEKPKDSWQVPDSTFRLAQMRLKMMSTAPSQTASANR